MYAVLGGFKDSAQLAHDPVGLPNPWVVSNYTDALASPTFWRQLANSTFVAVVSTSWSCCSRHSRRSCSRVARFPAASSMYTLFTLGLLFPSAVAVLPLFILVRDVGLLDNPLGTRRCRRRPSVCR